MRAVTELVKKAVKFWRELRPSPVYRLQIFLRSGNSIVLDGVTGYTFDTTGNTIARFSLVQKTSQRNSYLLISTLDLSQIEAVVRLPRR